MFDSNYYNKKRNLPTKEEYKKFKNDVIFTAGYIGTAIIVFLAFIFPNWDLVLNTIEGLFK